MNYNNKNEYITYENLEINNDPDPQIVVYDNYSISLYKYPRKNMNFGDTDIILIIFLMHEDFLKKVSESFDNAMKFYQQCKEYYYVFQFNKMSKKYSAQDIINISKGSVNSNSQVIDIIYYFYLCEKNFYTNLYESMEHAKRCYFERRDYTYRIVPPRYFYSNILPQSYSAIELMEINAYTQYLLQRKIIQELPMPTYFL
jgi:hypothetical protein